MTDEKRDIKDIRREVKERMDKFSKQRVSVDELISEDKTDFKELLKNNDELQAMCSELLEIAKTFEEDNEKLRRYLEVDKNALVARYYKDKLTDVGILKK